MNVPHHCLATVSVAVHTGQLGITSCLRIQGLPLPGCHLKAHAVRASSLRCCEIGSRNDVGTSFLNPGLPEDTSRDSPLGYAGNGSIGILGRFQGSLNAGFDRSLHLQNKHSHISGKCCTRLVELHDSACGVCTAKRRHQRLPCSEQDACLLETSLSRPPTGKRRSRTGP